MARKTPAEAEPAPDFETSLEELEALVERLERGDLQLEDALRSFERGVATAQAKVEILLKDGGETRLKDFTEPGVGPDGDDE
jgi:exodeoxyribonuclease VII small subunit